MQDPNVFEHIRTISEGCNTGIHDLSRKPEISVDGSLTKLIYTCVACGSKISISAPLNVNDLLTKMTPKTQQQQVIEQYVQNNNETKATEDGLNTDLLKKIFGDRL
mgnify:CR=1 FL=1